MWEAFAPYEQNSQTTPPRAVIEAERLLAAALSARRAGPELTAAERHHLVGFAARLRRQGVLIGTPADDTSELRQAIEAIEARRGWHLLHHP